MSQFQDSPPPFPSITPMQAPPREAGEIPPRPSTWPLVVGIISIIYAAMIIACNVFGFFTVKIMEWANDVSASAGVVDKAMEASIDVIKQNQALIITHAALAEITGIWLLIGAIMVLRRRAASRTTLRLWSIVEILLVLANMSLQVWLAAGTIDVLAAQDLSHLVTQVWISTAMQVVFGLVIGLALPVFLLIWFARQKVKAEVQTWP